MVWLIGAGLKAGTVEVRCPHCKRWQLRARVVAVHAVACKHCHRVFNASAAERRDAAR